MEVLDLLKKEDIRGKRFHAYLFFGGDRSRVQEIIQYFQDNRHYLPADVSNFQAGEKIGKGGEIKVEDVRQIIHDANLSPLGDKRLIVIQGCERLNSSSGNILLKTLEEPSPKVTFLLFSWSDSVLPTVRSRCRIYRLAPAQSEVSESTSLEFLDEGFCRASEQIEKIVKEEKIDFFLDKLEDQLRSLMLRRKDPNYSVLIRHVEEARRDLRNNVNARLVLENLALSYEEIILLG